MIISVNAGHCPGADPGACGVYTNEAEQVRDIATLVCDKLKNEGYKTVFIQEDELADICAIANDNESDLFVSIHLNAAENHDACGTETFFYQEGDPSYELASYVQTKLIDALGTEDRGVKDGSWLYVIRNTDAPAILVECGFISNEDEEVFIDNNKDVIATAIADGIIEYISTL